MEAPYERKPHESAKAYEAFSLYARKEAKRSLAAVGKELGKSVGLIERWSRRYDWVARAQAFDAHLALVAQEAAEEAIRAKAAERERRRDELLEEEWHMHHDCKEAVIEALKRFQETARRGAPLGDISQLAAVSSRLGRLATGMPTDRTELTGEEGGPIQLEMSTALTKIYGGVITATGNGHAKPRGIDPQMLLILRGNCTDPPQPTWPPPLTPPASPPAPPADSNPNPPTP